MGKSSTSRGARKNSTKARESSLSGNAPSGWIRFGWQGISGLVPPEWNIGAIGGDHKQGYLRLDDTDYPRLEVKWNQQQIDLSRVLEKYLRSMKAPKKFGGGILGKGRRAVEVDRKVKIISHRAKPSKEILGFSWQQAQGLKGAGVVWTCQVCRRTLFGQVRAYGAEDAVALAKRIFSSLEDHGEAGRLLWALYGLEFRIPEKYLLIGQSLMAGYLELRFQNRQRKLRVSRWGLAANLLAQGNLSDWFKTAGVSPKSGFHWQAHDTIIKEHPGLKILGRSQRPLARLGKSLRALSRSALKRSGGGPAESDGAGRVWHCSQSNRIYLVESLHEPEAEVLAEVIESINCH
ncbi:MAG: hypothetical protein GTO55_06380 [Armatimonadetes bacterium]|nr:hypothetical protein [Armatimonadota bacterium]NIM23878.1 hypothetical protein [Armatimonadota bacterium]NIM67757.1 hypothetical protein [Armatimonadota bacterium]NIM76266.1 hypothetical protein [Armatimonadota bacterium]NIN05959.1 hypothetical protein [Armatimonadota bacterium]